MGKPERAAQIILHGMEGDIIVNRKHYSLAMPPQGATLDDQQIADVLSYVRQSWGNKEGFVTKNDVTKARQSSATRNTPWKAEELIKLYGLPVEKSKAVKDNLIMSTYEGKWDTLPDFSKLDADAVEEEHSGFISLQNIHNEKNFGVVWEGEVFANTNHTFGFTIECTDGARLLIADTEVIRIDGTSSKVRKRTGGLTLKRGWHKLRLEYFNSSGDPQIRLYMGIGDQHLISDPVGKREVEKIILKPEHSQARLYKHFIKNATPYSLSVGYPGGMNLSYDTMSCSPVLIWKGDFIDASRHWNGRGIGWQTIPAGQQTVFKPNSKDTLVQYSGYQLDKNQYPTFKYTLGEDISVNDSFLPQENGFVRKLTFDNKGESLDYPLHLSSSGGKTMRIHTEGAKELPKSFEIKKGKSSLILNYTW